MTRLATILIVLCIATPAQATFLTGNKLLEFCTKTSAEVNLNACRGYIIGVIDAFENDQIPTEYKLCVPKGVDSGQVADVTRNYLTGHPEKRHLTANSLVWNAINEAWPCE